jgi:hypothetical protein
MRAFLVWLILEGLLFFALYASIGAHVSLARSLLIALCVCGFQVLGPYRARDEKRATA